MIHLVIYVAKFSILIFLSDLLNDGDDTSNQEAIKSIRIDEECPRAVTEELH